MKKFAFAMLLSTWLSPALAVGTFISAPNRVDMVHDDKRNLVYIVDGSQLLRYDVANGVMLPPLMVGGSLGGIDMAPDNYSLVIADTRGGATESWINIVYLEPFLVAQQLRVTNSDPDVDGTYSVAWAADNNIYASSTIRHYGWGPLRRINPVRNTWTTIASVTAGTMLSASGDANTIAFAEPGSSGGPWGLVDIPTGTVARADYSGTSWFNSVIATDRFGAQFSIPTANGNYVYDDTYQLVTKLGQYAGPRPMGVAYHPVERIAYFPWADTQEVYVYDMNNFTKIGSYDFQSSFTNSLTNGNTKLSRDGSLLMVAVDGGVRILRTYAPLTAASQTVATTGRQPIRFALAGSIGNGGSISYALASAPSHGKVVISDGNAVYTAQTGFIGTDTFRYSATYGRAYREAAVTVTINNTSPIAVDDYVTVNIAPKSIPVLANDIESDGQVLSIVSVTQPAIGKVNIVDKRLMFVPPVRFAGTTTFTYTISDGHGAMDTATVHVSKSQSAN